MLRDLRFQWHMQPLASMSSCHWHRSPALKCFWIQKTPSDSLNTTVQFVRLDLAYKEVLPDACGHSTTMCWLSIRTIPLSEAQFSPCLQGMSERFIISAQFASFWGNIGHRCPSEPRSYSYWATVHFNKKDAAITAQHKEFPKHQKGNDAYILLITDGKNYQG